MTDRSCWDAVGKSVPSLTFYNLSSDKRARILDAALDEFASQPYHSVSINRIVKAAGIAKGSFYQYFEGIVDLYRHLVFEYGAEQKMASMQAAGAPPHPDDLFATLAWYGMQGLQFGITHPRLAAASAHIRHPSSDAELQALHEELRLRSRAGLRAILLRGVASGEIRGDLNLETAVVFADVILRIGLDEVFVHHFGLDALQLCSRPEISSTISSDALQEAVSSVIELMRRGLGDTTNASTAWDFAQIASGFGGSR